MFRQSSILPRDSIRALHRPLVDLRVPIPSPTEPGPAHTAENPNTQLVQIVMRNAIYHYTVPIAVRIFHLQGELLPTKAGIIVFFDDKNSFTMILQSAEIAIDCNVLAQVLNEERLFLSESSPEKPAPSKPGMTGLSSRASSTRKTTSHSETTGALSANGDGRIRLPFGASQGRSSSCQRHIGLARH